MGGGKTPDEKTMGRLARQLRPEVIRQIHNRVVAMAQEEKIVHGRRPREYTTVVETNIHYRMSRKGNVFSGSQPRRGKSQKLSLCAFVE